jgi:NAD(P)H dehydrogenase (quinone)
LNISEVAKIISEVCGLSLLAPVLGPDDLVADLKKAGTTDPFFTKGLVEFFRQVVDGRMSYIAEVKDDVPKLLGRPGMKLRDWAQLNKKALIAQYQQHKVKV